MLLLLGDGGCDQLLLQCHQPLIGAPSPMHANQPWYPTVIFPTTSPGALAAAAGPACARSWPSQPPVAATAAVDRSRVLLEISMVLVPSDGNGPPPRGETARSGYP